MTDAVVNNLVLFGITVASLWWTIGGRNRRKLAQIKERLELLELLGQAQHCDVEPFERRLRDEVAALANDYVNGFMYAATLVVTASLVGGTAATFGWQLATDRPLNLVPAWAVGDVLAALGLVIVMTVRRLRSRAPTDAEPDR